MRANLDGIVEFDAGHITVSGWERDTIDRTAAGVDGVVSIDLGSRSRIIVQKGILRAVSKKTLDKKIEQIRSLADGQTHTLIHGDDQFDNVRIDEVTTGEKSYSGRGLNCAYEIHYIQLRKS